MKTDSYLTRCIVKFVRKFSNYCSIGNEGRFSFGTALLGLRHLNISAFYLKLIPNCSQENQVFSASNYIMAPFLLRIFHFMSSLNTFCMPILLYGLDAALPLSNVNFTILQSTQRLALYKICHVRDVNNWLYIQSFMSLYLSLL